MKVFNESNVPIQATNGTYKVGSLKDIYYKELVEILGEPTYDEPSGDNKVQVEWVIKYKDLLYTIYDWKTFDKGYTENELTIWSVGGNKNATQLINKILKKQNKLINKI